MKHGGDRHQRVKRLEALQLLAGNGSGGGGGGAISGPMLFNALQNTPPPNVTQSAALVSGYYTQGDGGGGVFYWDPNSTAASDGGTVVEVIGVPNGRWVRLVEDDRLNGLWFGMQAQGSPASGGFDNTAVTTNLINAANLQRKFVFIPVADGGNAYGFAASAPATDPLPNLIGALGLLGGEEGLQSECIFDDTDGSCFLLRSGGGVVHGILVVNNRTAPYTNRSANVHIVNAAYGNFENVSAFSSGTNSTGVHLEARYDLASVTLATNTTPIQITIDTSGFNAEQKQHALPKSGERWLSTGVTGNSGANGSFIIEVTSQTTNTTIATLVDSVGTGVGVAGTAIRDVDPDYLVHLGAWYNNFNNIVCVYNSVNTPVVGSWGFAMDPNPTLVGGITNPPGQPPGTYNSQLLFNTLRNCDVESKERGIYLDSVSASLFMGGLIGGSTHCIYGRGATNNIVIGQRLNQWVTSALNFDAATSRNNTFIGQAFFLLAATPWQIGPDSSLGNTIGTLGNLWTAADGINFSGIFARPEFTSSADGLSVVQAVDYGGPNFWEIGPGGIAQWAIGPREDNTGIACLYARPRSVTPTASNPVIAAVPDSFTTINVGPGGILQDSVNAVPVRVKQGWQGAKLNQQQNIQVIPGVFTTNDTNLNTAFKFTTSNGVAAAGTVQTVVVTWNCRCDAAFGSNSGGIQTALLENNGSGSVTLIGQASTAAFGTGALTIAAGTGGDANKILINVQAGNANVTEWEFEIKVVEN